MPDMLNDEKTLVAIIAAYLCGQMLYRNPMNADHAKVMAAAASAAARDIVADAKNG